MTKNAESQSTLPAFKDAAHNTESSHKQAVTTSDLTQLTKHKDQLQTLPILPILQVAFLTHKETFNLFYYLYQQYKNFGVCRVGTTLYNLRVIFLLHAFVNVLNKHQLFLICAILCLYPFASQGQKNP